MSGGRMELRPQQPAWGDRALLLARRDQEDAESLSMATALDTIASLGYDLIGVVDPSDYRVAHRMVADGLADVIVVARMDHLPSVRMAAPRGRNQTMPVLRPAAAGRSSQGEVPARQRRPQLTGVEEPQERRTQVLDCGEATRERIVQEPARSGAAGAPVRRSRQRRLSRRHAD